MSDDRRTILEMLATGRITADEADRLLAALDGRGPKSASSLSEPGYPANKPTPKYLRIAIDADEAGEDGPTKVNIRVPMQLLRAGVKLAAIIPPKARDEVNAAMRENGVPFDIHQLKPENLEELVEHLGDLQVDVDEKRTKVRIFCE
jgi:hypothetical protein